MANQNLSSIFSKKKWRVIGEVLKQGEIKNTGSWLAIHASSSDKLLTYESSGLVVAINGSGSLNMDHPQVQQAIFLTEKIVGNGGLVMTGGRSSGIMEAVAKTAQDKCLGIIFPEAEKEASSFGKTVMVNSPTPRIELLATCAPIVVIFRGGLGTLMMLMRAIVHIRNRKYHPDQLPQLIFVSNYWIGLLTTMMSMGCLPREFLTALNFFDATEQILSKIPINKAN